MARELRMVGLDSARLVDVVKGEGTASTLQTHGEKEGIGLYVVLLSCVPFSKVRKKERSNTE